MFIDPHVHCRDGKQSYKETIAHALSVAERAGMTAIFDMPNTDPPILTKSQAEERISLAKKINSPVFYGLYMGITSKEQQIQSAIEAYGAYPEVIGLKMFAGHSIGNLGVTLEADQQKIYETLAQIGYTGVIAVHCEKESLLKPQLWNPQLPITHTAARPPNAEVESVKDQIRFAQDALFQGTLHIAHISVPEAVDVVQQHKNTIKITCGVTPHHCILDSRIHETKNGIVYKCNPPLRLRSMADQMRDYLETGMIDWIETDHAPHTMDEKINVPHMSGLPGLPFYPKFVDMLKPRMNPEQLRGITFSNIVKTFKLDIKQRDCTSQKDITKNLAKEYAFDAYEHII
ncbi:MAG TPA: dihydroorotase family protein [Candidatus Nanoarchaeia archaeon]|nr:dihydroorotase family protein [Candidatus Nanoarchaeia archaeon]